MGNVALDIDPVPPLALKVIVAVCDGGGGVRVARYVTSAAAFVFSCWGAEGTVARYATTAAASA
jgi:hypothetical protein